MEVRYSCHKAFNYMKVHCSIIEVLFGNVSAIRLHVEAQIALAS